MKPRILGAVAVVAVCVAGCAARAQSKSDKLYTLTKPATITLQAGETGKAVIEIKATPGNHVNDEASAPFKVKVSGEGLSFPKAQFGHDDAKHGASSTTVEVPFTAVKAGETTLEADLVFVICTASNCLRQTDRVTIPVSVK